MLFLNNNNNNNNNNSSNNNNNNNNSNNNNNNNNNIFYLKILGVNFCILVTKEKSSATCMKIFVKKIVPKSPGFEEFFIFFLKSSYFLNAKT